MHGVGRRREGVRLGRRRVVRRVTAPAGVMASIWQPEPPLLGAEGPPCPCSRPCVPGAQLRGLEDGLTGLPLQQQPSPVGRATAVTRTRGQCAHSRSWPAGPRGGASRPSGRLRPCASGPRPDASQALGSSPGGPGPRFPTPGPSKMGPPARDTRRQLRR